MVTLPVEATNAGARAVLAVVREIPRGHVSTYGRVAERAGLPRRARLVGRVLAALPDGSDVPWHRVVAAGGRIAFPAGSPARDEQRARLADEGVPALRGRVDLERHGWHGAAGDLDRLLWRIEPPPRRRRDTSMAAKAYDRGPRSRKRRPG